MSNEKQVRGGSAFERVWKNRTHDQVGTKKEARIWFHLGMKELNRLQSLNTHTVNSDGEKQ